LNISSVVGEHKKSKRKIKNFAYETYEKELFQLLDKQALALKR